MNDELDNQNNSQQPVKIIRRKHKNKNINSQTSQNVKTEIPDTRIPREELSQKEDDRLSKSSSQLKSPIERSAKNEEDSSSTESKLHNSSKESEKIGDSHIHNSEIKLSESTENLNKNLESQNPLTANQLKNSTENSNKNKDCQKPITESTLNKSTEILRKKRKNDIHKPVTENQLNNLTKVDKKEESHKPALDGKKNNSTKISNKNEDCQRPVTENQLNNSIKISTKRDDSHKTITENQLNNSIKISTEKSLTKNGLKNNTNVKNINNKDFRLSLDASQLKISMKDSSKDEDCHKPLNAGKAFEILLNKVGDNHRFQWKMFFLAGITVFFTVGHNLGAVYLASAPHHWCNIPFKNQSSTIEKSFINFTVPWILDRRGELEPSKCRHYNFSSSPEDLYEYFTVNISTHDTHETHDTHDTHDLATIIELPEREVITCNSWIFDDELFISTVVSEWDLVCNDRWMKPAVQSTYMMGILVGALIFPVVSDRIGRRRSALFCGGCFIATSIAAAFTNSYVEFIILRFIIAATGQGLNLITFVLLMEFLTMKSRNLIGNLTHIFFGVGFLYLIFISYVIRDWRTLQLFISIPTLILLMHLWCLPESARWLLMQGKEEEGTQILKSISKCNDIPFPSQDEVEPLLKIIKEEVKCKPSLNFKGEMLSVLQMMITVVKTPNMRRRNLTMCYSWFVCSVLFYGLIFSGGNLSASVHAIGFYTAIADLIAVGVVIAMIDKFGRRLTLVISHISAGLSCLSIIFLPTDQIEWKLALAMFGKMCIGVSFKAAFIFSVESVPTNIRSFCVGMANASGRCGCIIAPYIVDLLGEIYYAIPSTIFGVISLLAGLLSIFLPETGNKQLPESIEEIESLPR